jgi:hypothetical protein
MIKDYDIYDRTLLTEDFKEREMQIAFSDDLRHDNPNIYCRVYMSKMYQKIYIKEVYFTIHGKKVSLVRNFRRPIYKEGDRITEDRLKDKFNAFAIGKAWAEIIFWKMKEGEYMEVELTQTYSFDNEPLRTETYIYLVRCFKRPSRLPRFLLLP